MAGPVQFIDLTARSSQASEQNRQLIRSHIAKSNRRKRILQTGQRQKQFAARPRLIAPLGLSLDDGDASVSPSRAEPSLEDENSEEVINANSGRSTILSPPARELAAPAMSCGALAAISSDVADHTSFGESANFMLHVIMPNAFLPPFAWFEVFCREPLVYHAFASQLNLQRVLANNSTLVPSRRRMLFHKGEAIRLLNDKFSNLKTEDIEAVLIGMLVVFPEEEEVTKASAHARHLLVAHMPWSNNSSIYAGNEPKSLARAIKHLVEKAGGLLNLKVLTFPKTISKADLVLASSGYSRPLFPWMWPVSPAQLYQNGGPHLTSLQDANAGYGFDQVADRVSAPLISCLKNLAFVDQAMADTRNHRIQGFDLDLLITARDTAHHCLLTLPKYSELDEMQMQSTDAFVYECCRLTSIIFVNCVMSPLLPGCPGISEPLDELCRLIKSRSRQHDDQIDAQVLLWSVCIGGLAGFRSEKRKLFVQVLQQIVSAHSIASLDQALTVCRKFVWSDCACLQGVTVLWDYVDTLPEVIANAEREP